MTSANNRPKHKLETVLAAIEKGVTVTDVARALGCSRVTVYNYQKRWASVREAFEAKRAELVDYGEIGLRAAVLAKEPWAIQYVLRTLGKDRGYTERHELTGKDGDPIELRIVEQIVTRRYPDDSTA